MGRFPRHGSAAVGVLGVIAGCCVLAAPASAAGPSWVASGTLAGSYSNSVGWDNCPETGHARATATESLTLDVKISPGRAVTYAPKGFALPVTMTLSSGSWSATGSVPPRQEQPDGSITCGAQQSVECSGAVMQEGGTIVGRGRATLTFAPSGASILGRFIQNPGWTETTGDDPCPFNGANSAVLYGLQGTDIVADALLENDAHPAYLTIPRTRFAGRKAFTATNVAGPDGGCPRPYYDQCTESGSLTLTLHFKPRRSGAGQTI